MNDPLGISPSHTMLVTVLATASVLGFLWKITRTLANMQIKMDMMWRDFQKRYNLERNNQ